MPKPYNCSKCPGYCCSYPIIPITRRDLKRLAAHFGIGFNKAKARFTTPNPGDKDGEFKLRRKADEHFGAICRFFDTDERRCTVYKARPGICRAYPTGRCGYYDFLKNERDTQEDQDMIATTWNK